MGEIKGVHRDMVRKLEGRRPPGRPRHRWENNIEMDLQEAGYRAWTGWNWLMIGTRSWQL
jgi:hypothetical protein